MSGRDHLVSAPGTGFRFWRWFLLRSAGFPYEQLESLASEALGAAADRALRAGAAARVADEAARAALATVRMPSREAWRALRDLFRAAREGEAVDPSHAPGETRELVRALAEAAREQREADAAYQSLRGSELARARTRLREALQDDAREALLLQSRGAFRAVERLPPVGAPRNHPVKRDEQTAVLHLQRCCAKNDTISFFGPALGDAAGPGRAVAPGRRGAPLHRRAATGGGGSALRSSVGVPPARIRQGPGSAMHAHRSWSGFSSGCSA